MTPRPGPTATDESTSPPTRAERQQQTRAALVDAAREVFARDGFHAARLDLIAREAGFSKGAVYSNFASKADLFLAVMDANLATVGHEPWDPFGEAEVGSPTCAAGDTDDIESAEASEDAETSEAMRGFALATLEFIATAGRDPGLTAQLSARIQLLLDLYTGVADTARSEQDPLGSAELGALLTALDQGAALLTLGGVATIDQRVLRAGLRRLASPGRAAEGHEDASPGAPALHDEELRRRIIRSMREGHQQAAQG
ncbi:helix-turn-helix domain-containing protein [Actinotalea sp. K2]|uniref:helix-turn-helix domain-containing protein n=1 Tax=Actinotalea sp. K2 TaxID=2939438 RepID=UPI002017A9EB|nr:helix-turn-helix domain-containing protein [Actinotalea sp. K2]MCL3861602.1 TetR/AcrR family transcriptional regulator [Actinotalea sp. K2]